MVIPPYEFIPVNPRETPYLYKYRDCQNIERDLESLLKEQRIYCPSPAQFNDPWDCHYNLDKNYGAPYKLENVKIAMRNIALNSGRDPFGEEVNMVVNQHCSSPERIKKLMVETEKSQNYHIKKNCRVYSLSSKWNSIPLWGYYASAHTGYCIQFRTNTNPFNKSQPVSYSNELPLVSIEDTDVFKKMKPLITKSIEWEREKEYRIIPCTENVDGYPLIVEDGNWLPIDNNAIKSIILGLNIAEGHQEKIINIVNKYMPSISVEKIGMDTSEYSLLRKNIS